MKIIKIRAIYENIMIKIKNQMGENNGIYKSINKKQKNGVATWKE